jgi:hypothetical protein
LLVVQSQERGAEEKNISWHFDVMAEVRTDRGNIVSFEKKGNELHCGDGRPGTVSTPINVIR